MEHNPSFFRKHATSSKNVENMSSVPDERRKKRGLFVYKVSDRVQILDLIFKWLCAKSPCRDSCIDDFAICEAKTLVILRRRCCNLQITNM
ncbi:hypothetical protein MTR_2g011335 [Medicago truncatula]|uniref:Uncharacterized protein n=1 Tax=Medicago truncatula TaxID=3880 RepID=A0A072V3T0_MEDTR|nr:hypothetical protein MTR_2g011335 [Medicago truncatula]